MARVRDGDSWIMRCRREDFRARALCFALQRPIPESSLDWQSLFIETFGLPGQIMLFTILVNWLKKVEGGVRM